jgi:WD40 repeat protein
MSPRFGQRIGAILPLLVVIMIFGCSGCGSSAPKAERPPPKPNFELEPRVREPVVVSPRASFLGISSDFKVYATGDANGVKVVDLETGKQLASPTWDKDWGYPCAAVFGVNVMAFHTTYGSLKIFSRKTGELEQNVHIGFDERGEFTAGGRLLAITESRFDNGCYLVLRDVQMKKTVAEVRLGDSRPHILTLTENRVAIYEGLSGQITVVETKTGAVVKKSMSQSFIKTTWSVRGRTVLAISPAGNLLACNEEDAVVLYDVDGDKVAQKLEGHLDTVRAVRFSPNGETVASAAQDKTIRFWNVKTGKETNAIKNLPRGVSRLIFSADGKKIAVVYGDPFSPASGPCGVEIRSVEPK